MHLLVEEESEKRRLSCFQHKKKCPTIPDAMPTGSFPFAMRSFRFLCDFSGRAYFRNPSMSLFVLNRSLYYNFPYKLISLDVANSQIFVNFLSGNITQNPLYLI